MNIKNDLFQKEDLYPIDITNIANSDIPQKTVFYSQKKFMGRHIKKYGGNVLKTTLINGNNLFHILHAETHIATIVRNNEFPLHTISQ